MRVYCLGSGGLQCHGVTFHTGTSRKFCTSTFEIYFSFHKVIWIDATNDYTLSALKKSLYLYFFNSCGNMSLSTMLFP